MRIYWHSIKETNGKKRELINDITDYFASVEWSGAQTEAARTLVLSVADNPYYSAQNAPDMILGDGIDFIGDRNKRLFLGGITGREKTGEIGTRSITAKDFMVGLLRSNITHKYKGKTAESIAKDVCGRVGVTAGSLSRTKIKQGKIYVSDTSAYNVIMKAYHNASAKNGVKYFPYMDGTKFCVKQKGQIDSDTFILSMDTNITESHFEENIDDMVNKVLIYNSKGKNIGSVKKTDWISLYGVFQHTITAEKGNGRAAARNELHDKTRTMSISCIGDERCISGSGIYVRDTASGLIGLFWIESDTHTWENGNHKMSLTLTLKNVTENPDVSVSSSSGSSSSTSSKESSDDADKLIKYAKKYVGKVKYVYGGSRPDLGRSDCSGFTMFVFNHALGISLPHNARTQANHGYKKINSMAKMKKGDLMFFANESTSIDHVGIYAGNKKLIQVWNSGCCLTSINLPYIRKHFKFAERIIK